MSSSSSFVAKILEPGGGVMLLPFVRTVIVFLLLLCLTAAFFMDVARIHMLILSFLSAGLLISLSFFENEYNKVRRGYHVPSSSSTTTTTTTTTSSSSNGVTGNTNNKSD